LVIIAYIRQHSYFQLKYEFMEYWFYTILFKDKEDNINMPGEDRWPTGFASPLEYSGGSAPPEYPENQSSLQLWWDQVLRDHGRYSCYAILLLLPSDEEARRYVREFGQELNLISGESCLVIGLSKKASKRSSPDSWGAIVDEEVPQGYSITVAELFGINDFNQYPCLIIFEDIHSSNHIVIALGDMSSEEIARKMRSLFSIIKKAVSEKKSPLNAIENDRNKKIFHRGGETIISELRSLAGKTFEMAIEAWIKNFVK